MAERCLALCKERDVDSSLLLALRHWQWLDSSRFGTKLKSFVEMHTTMGTRHAHSESFMDAFEKRVLREIRKSGIVNLAPGMKVEAYRKAELFEKYRAVKDQWPSPHVPYLIQMRPGLFILLANYQAGFHLMRDMATTRWYEREDGKLIPVELLYEGQIEGEPCRCILDCEAYMSHFEQCMTYEELVESVRQVPQVLTKALVRIGAIRREDKVIAVEKYKCRGEKVSFHFSLNIVGDPTVDLKSVLRDAIISPYIEERARCKKDKSAACMAERMTEKDEDGLYKHALFHVDEATIKGKHQFSAVFSRKAKEEPCRIDWIHGISDGGKKVVRKPSMFRGIPMVPGHERALDMLYMGGFTHWIPNTLVLNPKFRIVAGPVPDLDGGSALSVSSTCLFFGLVIPAVRLELTRYTPRHFWRW